MSKPERNTIKFEDILARDEKANVLFFNYDRNWGYTPIHKNEAFFCKALRLPKVNEYRHSGIWWDSPACCKNKISCNLITDRLRGLLEVRFPGRLA